MKNWGHDFLRAQNKEASNGDKEDSKSEKTKEKKHVGLKNKHGRKKSLRSDGDDDVDGEAGDNAGSKRKVTNKERRPSKKRETQEGLDSIKSEEDMGDEEAEVNGTTDDEEEHAGTKRKASNKGQKPSKKRETYKGQVGTKRKETDLRKGDDVSWNWGGSHPHAKVLDVKKEK